MPYTKQNSRVPRFQIVTEFAGNTGTAIQVNATASLESLFTNDAVPTEAHSAPWRQVSFDMIAPAISGLTITAAGQTVTYLQLAALLRQASLDRATAQGIT